MTKKQKTWVATILNKHTGNDDKPSNGQKNHHVDVIGSEQAFNEP